MKIISVLNVKVLFLVFLGALLTSKWAAAEVRNSIVGPDELCDAGTNFHIAEHAGLVKLNLKDRAATSRVFVYESRLFDKPVNNFQRDALAIYGHKGEGGIDIEFEVELKDRILISICESSVKSDQCNYLKISSFLELVYKTENLIYLDQLWKRGYCGEQLNK